MRHAVLSESGAAAASLVHIDTAQGTMRAILACPAGPGPHPGVIMYPHVGGLTDTMRGMAEYVAGGGWLCVVPDLYHRLGIIVIDPQSHDEDVVAIRKIVAPSVTDAGAMDDTRSVFDWLRNRQDVVGQAYGTIGFGRGGSLAVIAASTFPERVRAAASVLGFGFLSRGQDEARAMLSRVTGGLYCAFAELDEIIPRSEFDGLAGLLREVKPDAQIILHEGTRHPYVFPDRAVHDKVAAERDWRAIFSMYSRALRGTSGGGT